MLFFLSKRVLIIRPITGVADDETRILGTGLCAYIYRLTVNDKVTGILTKWQVFHFVHGWGMSRTLLMAGCPRLNACFSTC